MLIPAVQRCDLPPGDKASVLELIEDWLDDFGDWEDELEGDCVPRYEGGFWTDPNDPTA